MDHDVDPLLNIQRAGRAGGHSGLLARALAPIMYLQPPRVYGSKGHEDDLTAEGQRRLIDDKVTQLHALFADCASPDVLRELQLVRSPAQHHRYLANSYCVP
eukprot:SAG31_NODE_19603_length_597_cov_1.026104_1_plen_102_part_00